MEIFLLGKATLLSIDKVFGLRNTAPKSLSSLEQWIKRGAAVEISAFEEASCINFRNLLDTNLFNWQEQELSLHFIGPMFSLVHFTEPYRYNLFAQRPIEATLNEILLTGIPDEIIASGYYEPEVPFFAFAEYKRQRDPDGDPAGQALAAMLVGQTLNSNRHPVYGCFVIGSDWYFMSLEGKSYSISRAMDAMTDDVFDILRTLKAFKEIVRELAPPLEPT